MIIYKYYLEIKYRIFLLFLNLIFTIFICYIYKEILLFLCLTKINLFYHNQIFYFIFTDVKEVFSVFIKLICFISKQICIFYLFFHILSFISLGLYEFEYKYLKFVFYSGMLFWLFWFFLLNQILLPISWNFFLSFQSSTEFNLYFEAKLNEYLNFYIFLYDFCLLYCQIFLIFIVFINYINTNLDLIKNLRKIFHYCFIIFSTLVTPPDIISQILFSFFIIGVYEMLIILNLLKDFLKVKNH